MCFRLFSNRRLGLQWRPHLIMCENMCRTGPIPTPERSLNPLPACMQRDPDNADIKEIY